MWPWNSSTVQQTSASFTDQKLRKENNFFFFFFKTIHLVTAETDVSMVLHFAVCPSFEIRPRWKTTSDFTVICSQVPFLVRFVSIEIKTIYLESIQQCFFHCISFAKVENSLPHLLQITDSPYWNRTDFDMVSLSTLQIVFHPSMTVAWVPQPPPLPPFFRWTLAQFQLFKHEAFPEYVCWGHWSSELIQ